MSTILVGVDGNEPSIHAATRAADLAKALGAELVVVCAFSNTEEVRYGDESHPHKLSASDAARALATQAVEKISASAPDVTITPRAEYGKPGAVLVQLADDLDATLIVVGNKRVQGVARVLGSIATDVARHAPCDVYVAHTY
ncbi:universal stress protein [Aeromicrobium sp. 636]|uniref:Universal stress protein n=1 Tax=Aeromicrobium senzhongii TaxID=2663859 RepID=A0A8I0EWA1_9ACTN|nr:MULTISPECIES: universal stress protein [Aeromicrobium]MBC9226497.1 universal stress protein [Aeromicrobium senzhongii]MCQ3998601.1 universal stress protein [Aeromicrobium sp. 636]